MCGQCGGNMGNEAHADAIASAHSNKNEKTTELLIAEIRARLDWISVDFRDDKEKDGAEGGEVEEKRVRLLDYGCGGGMISRALAPYITQAVGMDVSPHTVHEYNTWSGSITPQMSAFVGNLLDPADPSPAAFKGEEFWGFDLAVVGLGFHQINETVLAATRIAERLRTGGVLLILDFVVDQTTGGDGDVHQHDHGFWKKYGHGSGGGAATKRRKQRGFGELEIKGIFENAGVGKDFGFEVIAKGAVFETAGHNMTADVFMARGTRV
ncbi:S-adenosyl-L-methionine-dependent methyltransferase [Hyaloscypha sp. PMI_1271]|nr:S-adenosyl-L-methionine-dependent methyltransferase [Hyaloscypha sp. PMI_1271]